MKVLNVGPNVATSGREGTQHTKPDGGGVKEQTPGYLGLRSQEIWIMF